VFLLAIVRLCSWRWLTWASFCSRDDHCRVFVLTSTAHLLTLVAYNFSFAIVVPLLFSCSLDGFCFQTWLFLWCFRAHSTHFPGYRPPGGYTQQLTILEWDWSYRYTVPLTVWLIMDGFGRRLLYVVHELPSCDQSSSTNYECGILILWIHSLQCIKHWNYTIQLLLDAMLTAVSCLINLWAEKVCKSESSGKVSKSMNSSSIGNR